MIRTRAYLLMLLGILLTGCAQSEEYNISVKNNTTKPLMFGLAKDGPPFEDEWASPEQIVRSGTRPGVWEWGVPLLPGQQRFVNKLRGSMARGTTGYVRVYADAKTLDDFLSISRGSSARLDLPVRPGDNSFTIYEENGRLAAHDRAE